MRGNGARRALVPLAAAVMSGCLGATTEAADDFSLFGSAGPPGTSGPPAAQRNGGQLPSFLGADTLKALEAANSSREAPPSQPAAPTPAPHPAAAAAEPAKPDPAARRKAAEEQAKRRAEDIVRQKSRSGSAPPEQILTEDEIEAQQRADARQRQLLPPPDKAATFKPAAAAPGPAESIAPASAQLPAAGVPAQYPAASPTKAPSVATLLQVTPAKAAEPKLSAGDCAPPKVTAEAVPGGRARLALAAPCHGGKPMRLQYGDYAFERPLDASGQAAFLVDLFQGTGVPVAVVLGDSAPQAIALPPTDLEKVSKIAIVWTAPVNLDLHAFAYGAADRDPGHVWADAPSSLETARQASAKGQGQGFLSSADDGQAQGPKVEVYTYLHGAEDAPGTVAMALDYESRGTTPKGDTCGQGALASVPFDVIVVERGRLVSRESGIIAAASCGTTLATAARYARSAVPELRIRR